MADLLFVYLHVCKGYIERAGNLPRFLLSCLSGIFRHAIESLFILSKKCIVIVAADMIANLIDGQIATDDHFTGMIEPVFSTQLHESFTGFLFN